MVKGVVEIIIEGIAEIISVAVGVVIPDPAGRCLFVFLYVHRIAQRLSQKRHTEKA